MGKKHFGHIEIPLQRVHIELTNVCEFNCVFCPKTQMTRPYGYMDTDLARKIITEIGENGICDKITFHVMGEPTLHRDFFKILDHAQKVGVPVGLTTNGAGLGGSAGKRLLDYDLHQIDISLQTPDEKSFGLRKAGKMTYENYVHGILDFFSSYQARGRETIMKFRFLNTRFPKKRMEKKIGPVRVIPSTEALRSTFSDWAGKIYDIVGADRKDREKGTKHINGLVSYKWNVIEIYPRVFFETYVLDDWGAAFDDEKIHDAWAGYCFGMRDHFSILYNGDVVLCCRDFNGNTAIGNLHESSMEEVLSSDILGEILDGFKKYRVVHPYCKRCLGSPSVMSWMFKPAASVLAMKTLKPFFYNKVSHSDKS
jgi:MoaA/NifB/PqqE/SkfB family radical SAM enzyme